MLLIFPFAFGNFFTYGSVGNNGITFPTLFYSMKTWRCSLRKTFVRLKMKYVTSIQVM